MPEQKDQDIIDRVLNGDTQAFNILVLKYQQSVANFIYRIIKQQNDVSDIAQETFLSAYKGLKSFNNQSSFSTWLYRIATNAALNYLKTKKRRPPTEDVDVDDAEVYNFYLEDQGSNTEDLLIGEQQYKQALDIINSLPIKLKEPLILREQNDNSYEEIAVILNVSVEVVKSRIFRARDLIKKELSKLNII